MRYMMLLLSMCIFLQAYGHENEEVSNLMIEEQLTAEHEQRVYLSPQEIEICEEGIFVHLYGQTLKITKLNSDKFGIFFRLGDGTGTMDYNTCLNKHPVWCSYCRGCAVSWCLYGRCKCVAWE